ncbi:TPA: hypothetical protein N0F65_010566 [Lagenidium giganteum]|uniref:Lipoprotein n=1 Tax=Lagenidium giganteum TaxID=4803 RepID=A0AAV2YI25_9STRA|nr:TPA: hypothetical protein N0F65_010566 [Lagenidium giganteum]
MAGCGPTEIPISVEGVANVLCVAGTPCSADNPKGACPLKHFPDLRFGSGCGIVASGAYGCKPYSQVTLVSSPQRDPLSQCVGNAGGNVPVSVLGAGTYCTSDPVCAGTQRGNCPGPASGLKQPARCDFVRPGVLGCMV